MENVNPKIHVGSASAGVGGGSAAVILIWVMQAFGVSAESFTPERVVAITAICAFIGSYIGGYAKSDTAFQRSK